ncbi:DUF7344 domain-containing protein [Salinilacihabitans rarus]|uniref:DUF7344 domain-containing protein n=1 Tax=Salinilacihabitans rarus TaxID=2961596 RepID=UPI0020C8E66C|nr:hypothetical protein [Salinilacihabitans rarus]
MATSPHEIETLATERANNTTIFTTLAEPRRRFSLRYLRAADTPIKVGDLAAEIAAWESRRTAAGRPDGDVDRIEVALVHNHLPSMDDVGFIEYDSSRGTVALTDHDDRIQSHLRICGGNRP